MPARTSRSRNEQKRSQMTSAGIQSRNATTSASGQPFGPGSGANHHRYNPRQAAVARTLRAFGATFIDVICRSRTDKPSSAWGHCAVQPPRARARRAIGAAGRKGKPIPREGRRIFVFRRARAVGRSLPGCSRADCDMDLPTGSVVTAGASPKRRIPSPPPMNNPAASKIIR